MFFLHNLLHMQPNALQDLALIGSNNYETNTSVSDPNRANITALEEKISQLETKIEKMITFGAAEEKVRDKRYSECRLCQPHK